MRSIGGGVLLLLILFATGTVFAQSGVCRVSYYYWDETTKASSSRHLIGEFPMGRDSLSILKEFRLEDAGVDIFVGVASIKGVLKGEPKKLRMVLAFDGTMEDVFDELTRAEAETLYDKNWKWLRVTKSKKVGSREYTYSFGCEKTKGL